MLLIIMFLAFCLIFLSGFHWCAYKINKTEGKDTALYLTATFVCGLLGFYHLISIVGMSS